MIGFRILDLIRQPHLTSFATITADGSPWVRYVVARAADDLTLRFATDKHSRKVAQIQERREVHMTSGVTDAANARSYVQIQGKAQFVATQAEREGFWHDDLKKYFTGPDDPNYGIVVVKPYRIEYYTMGQFEPQVWEQ